MHQMNSTPSTHEPSAPPASIERRVLLQGRRDNQCWFSPSIAAIPTPAGMQVVINVHQLTGNDNGPMHTIYTVIPSSNQPADGESLRAASVSDRTPANVSVAYASPSNIPVANASGSYVSGACTCVWCPPFESQAFYKIPLEDDVFEVIHTTGLFHHRQSGRILAHGGTHFVRDQNLNPRYKTEWFLLDKSQDSSGVLSFWDSTRHDFTPWRRLEAPQLRQTGQFPYFFGLNQCCELENGSILMPLGVGRADKTAAVTTAMVQVDGDDVRIERIGTQIGHKLYEPSMVEFEGRFYLTIRSEQGDERMYHSSSSDGLTWGREIAWQWDDDSPVQTANTQQHWMKLGGALYLVYTRKSELNNGVFRYRAPLYMARVQVTDRPRLVRESEQIVFPEKGARMGNFSICSISENEAWIVTGEWMQQWIEGYRPDQFGWVDSGDDVHRYNRLIYRGDLLLAKVRV